MANLKLPQDVSFLAESFQELVNIIRDGKIDHALSRARELSREIEALLPERSLEELGPAYYPQLPGMHCRVAGEKYLGIILSVDADTQEATIINISPEPFIYISDLEFVVPLFSEPTAWPARGRLAPASEEPEIQIVDSPEMYDEPDGYPISFEEFIKLPARSTVRSHNTEQGITAYRVRKNRWAFDGVDALGNEHVNDEEAWDLLATASEDCSVICTYLGK